MNLSGLRLFELLKQKMAYESERQAVLAQNIANADTPNYKPKDIKKPDFSKMVDSAGGIKLAVTNPGHISPDINGLGNRFGVVTDFEANEMKPDGNAVNVEEQMMKMSQNSMDYQTSTGIYKKITDMLRLAIGSGRQ